MQNMPKKVVIGALLVFGTLVMLSVLPVWATEKAKKQERIAFQWKTKSLKFTCEDNPNSRGGCAALLQQLKELEQKSETCERTFYEFPKHRRRNI